MTNETVARGLLAEFTVEVDALQAAIAIASDDCTAEQMATLLDQLDMDIAISMGAIRLWHCRINGQPGGYGSTPLSAFRDALYNRISALMSAMAKMQLRAVAPAQEGER